MDDDFLVKQILSCKLHETLLCGIIEGIVEDYSFDISLSSNILYVKMCIIQSVWIVFSSSITFCSCSLCFSDVA